MDINNGETIYYFSSNLKIINGCVFAAVGERGYAEIAITESYIRGFGGGISLSGTGIAVLE